MYQLLSASFNVSFFFLFQSHLSLCQLRHALPVWPSVTPLTCSALWNPATTLAFPPRWRGASSRPRVAASCETWWRSHVTARYSGVSRSWASVHAPQWTVHATTPTSASVSPELGAKSLGCTSAPPSCTAEIIMAPGRSSLTARLTCWASMYCSQVCCFLMLLSAARRRGWLLKWCVFIWHILNETRLISVSVCVGKGQFR